jgi:hypothetical protein
MRNDLDIREKPIFSNETKPGPVLMKSSVLLDKPMNNSWRLRWKIASKEYLSILTSINNPVAVLRDQGEYE